MLTHDEIRTLGRASDLRGGVAVLMDWAAIAALFALPVLAPHPLVTLAAILLMARQQLALAILMHEAAHQRLFATRALNEYFGQLLTGAPILVSMPLYRSLHLKHHRAPLHEEDPDLSLIGGYPIDGASFRRKLLRDVSGISYFKFVAFFVRGALRQRQRAAASPLAEVAPGAGDSAAAADGAKPPGRFVAGSLLAAHGTILGALVAAGHGWLYLLLWWLPLMTVLQLLLRIRGIAEHAGYAHVADQRLCSRTVVNPLQTFVFAPHLVGYHIEHHLYPGVPFFNLPRVHALLTERGALPAANVYTSYRAVLRDLIVERPLVT